jgi:hypothetical protein
MFTAEIQSSRLCRTFLDRTTLSPTPSLGSSPSLRHHHAMHWPHRRSATTSSEHSWGQPPPGGSRNYQLAGSWSPSTVTSLPGDLDRTFQLPYVSKCSSPPMSVAPRHQSNGEAGRTVFCVARRAEGLPHLGTCLPILPALQSLPPHSHSIGRIYTATAPFLYVHIDFVGPLPTSAG